MAANSESHSLTTAYYGSMGCQVTMHLGVDFNGFLLGQHKLLPPFIQHSSTCDQSTSMHPNIPKASKVHPRIHCIPRILSTSFFGSHTAQTSSTDLVILSSLAGRLHCPPKSRSKRYFSRRASSDAWELWWSG